MAVTMSDAENKNRASKLVERLDPLASSQDVPKDGSRLLPLPGGHTAKVGDANDSDQIARSQRPPAGVSSLRSHVC